MILRLKNITWSGLPAGITPDYVRIESLRVRASALGSWTARWVSNINNDSQSVTYLEQTVQQTQVNAYESFGPILQGTISRVLLDSPTFGLRLQFAPSGGGTGTADVDVLTLGHKWTNIAQVMRGTDWGAVPDLADEYHELVALLGAIHDLHGALETNAALAHMERYDAEQSAILRQMRGQHTNAQAPNDAGDGRFTGRITY